MKPALFLFRALLGMAGTLLIGAALPGSARGQDVPRATFVTPATPGEQDIQSLGERAIDRIAVSLINEVRLALSAGEPEDAIDMCHLKGLSANGGTVSGLPRVSGAKLTSLKIRAHDNAPDAGDKLALDLVARTLANGDAPPKVLVQRIDTSDGAPEWRVYKPLGVSTRCLTCHGNPADQSPKLRARLKGLYPEDQATGYQAQEWRGLIRVIVAAEPAK
jgi:hypothetical protein